MPVRRTKLAMMQLLPLAALLLVPGCFGHASPATGTVAGYRQPVLLGPVDRIGMTEPLRHAVVGKYGASGRASYTQSTSTSGNMQYTTTTEINDKSEPYTKAATALAGKGPGGEVRLTRVKARSFGYFTGIISNRVVLEGKVVVVGGDQ